MGIGPSSQGEATARGLLPAPSACQEDRRTIPARLAFAQRLWKNQFLFAAGNRDIPSGLGRALREPEGESVV
jgi:hypothetical protein